MNMQERRAGDKPSSPTTSPCGLLGAQRTADVGGMRSIGLAVAGVAVAAITSCSAAAEPASLEAPQSPAAAPSPSSASSSGESFALYTHCETIRTEYAGRWWVATTPLPQHTARPDASNLGRTDDYTEGVITRVQDDLLRFVVQDARIEESGIAVDLVPTDAPTSWCE